MKTINYLLLTLGLTLASGLSLAADGYGSWKWAYFDDNSGTFALTASDSGKALTQVCYFNTGECIYSVNFPASCETGSSYSALVNSDTAAFTIDMVCHNSTSLGGFYNLADFDRIDQIVRKSNKVGFAMAMEGGAFSVVRFSLSGSSATLDEMRKNFLVASKAKDAISRQVKGDQVL
ncbi:hypothetical protein [Microbulbifer hainanensis]|uniref:hypothetical protein n=1 Tax=Microbulbifer hainanensis TaxID=2735675 RepID=UPI0018662128|nr:hypothetical protein [Microbulbifer hainanensis]